VSEDVAYSMRGISCDGRASPGVKITEDQTLTPLPFAFPATVGGTRVLWLIHLVDGIQLFWPLVELLVVVIRLLQGQDVLVGI